MNRSSPLKGGKGSADCQILGRFACIQGSLKPQRFSPTPGPGEARVFWMAVFRGGGRTGGFYLGADQVCQGIAHLFGDCVQLGAGLGFVTVLISGNRLGEVLV